MSTFFKVDIHQTRTLTWWNSRRGQIDFDPPYQRKGGLWSTTDKAFLIDSIINGFDIPKLYLADYQFGQSELNRAKLPYAIIDGKQRLEAIFDFFDGSLALDSKFRWRFDKDLRLGGLTLKDLRSRYPSVAEEFENASLTIMSVFTNDETLINELFVRLNRSKALTGAEVRNAMPGSVPNVIRELASHLVFREVIRFSTRRAGDANAAAKVLLFEYEETTTSTKKRDLDLFASGSHVDSTKLELAARRCIDVLDDMLDVFRPSDPLLASSGVFPVYFWFVRQVDNYYHNDIRTFLVEFEDMRKNNRELQKSDPNSSALDKELTRYDTLNRSTNDSGSHRARVEILLKRFERELSEIYGPEHLEKAPMMRG